MYILFFNTSILHFRSLNYINNNISVAIDRETIVSLHKKGESNLTIAKELQIRRETVWKWSRSSGRQARHPITGQGQKEKSSAQANG